MLAAADAQDLAAQARDRGEPDGELAHQAAVIAAKTKLIVDDLTIRSGSRLFDVGGASATKKSRNLDRHWRNARTLASHNPGSLKARALGEYELHGTPLPSAGLLLTRDIASRIRIMTHSASGSGPPSTASRAAFQDPDEPFDASWERNRRLVLEAEALGYDSTLIAQHTFNPHRPDFDQLDAWTGGRRARRAHHAHRADRRHQAAAVPPRRARQDGAADRGHQPRALRHQSGECLEQGGVRAAPG